MGVKLANGTPGLRLFGVCGGSVLEQGVGVVDRCSVSSGVGACREELGVSRLSRGEVGGAMETGEEEVSRFENFY